MMQQWLKIELLSDVVVTADAATQGEHEALDFLPGSLLRGAVINMPGMEFSPEIFFSGKVRFNNAYPFCDGKSPSYPVPLSYHTEKLNPVRIYNGIFGLPEKQMRQMRGNYLSASKQKVKVGRNYRMKTAIDRDNGFRSAESQLFGYDAIVAGTVFAAHVDFDDDVASDTREGVINHLIKGTVRLGKSRSAEYGQVKISRLDGCCDEKAGNFDGGLIIYLASDMAIERNGVPVTRITPEDLELPAGLEIDWQKSFIRVRKYSPWNAWFASRMRERQVICRGSVITLRGKCDVKAVSEKFAAGFGLYREEGLGKILVNPSFLCQAMISELPEAETLSAVREEIPADEATSRNDRLLQKVLAMKAQRMNLISGAQEVAMKWVDKWLKVFAGSKSFPGKSQWASIRKIAHECGHDRKVLNNSLDSFCGDGSRQAFWNAERRRVAGGSRMTLLELVKSDIVGETQEAIISAALYAAAVEVARRIDNNTSVEVGHER